VGQAGDSAVDFGLILATMTEEPTLASWLFSWIVVWIGVAAGLTFVIFVHELGHFLVAKACGVKCEKFYVGFDFFEFKIPFTPWKIPRSLFKFQWGETEYGIGSLPLGGYVKMLGQDDDPRNAEAEAAKIRAGVPSEASEALAHPHPGHPEEAVAAKTTEGKTILLDPRSYPAKPVPARMAIISAGVIMNLIFAVVLAAAAYKLGVEEMPAIVGSTSPGGAAWVRGIQPGSKIRQFGEKGEPNEFLRFGDIRTTAILNSGHSVSFLVRSPSGEDKWYEVEPKQDPKSKLPPMIGIGPPHKPEIEIFPEAATHLNPQVPSTATPLKDFDRVIEAGGQKVTSGADLTTIFAQNPIGPLDVKIERRPRTKSGQPIESPAQQPEVFDVQLQEKPMRELGLSMKIGPIVAIQENSPAAKADLQIGDVIVEVNGQPVGDPLSLSQRLTPKPGENSTVSLVVERKGTRRPVNLAAHAPLQSSTYMPMNPTAVEPIGVAIDVTLEVAAVVDDGPAAKAGLLSGDVITHVEYIWNDKAVGEMLSKAARLNLTEKIELGPKKASWPVVVYSLQRVYPDTKIKLTWTRAGKTMSAVMLPRDSATYFDDARGIVLYPDFRERTAKSFGEAAVLGFREARDQLMQVLTILHRLVTARLSPTNLSGPFGIIGFAGAVAKQGPSALLLFLTMLSANLAVLNFLPIPALDGGHMLFLSAEAVRGKPVDERLQIRLTVAGVVCLLSLMVFATAMDFQRWFG
jgi:regulator of sigma E protease